MPDVVFRDLCLDANRPELVGRFWSRLLARPLELHEDGSAHLSGAARGEFVWVNAVPEAQEVKNRVHLDVRLTDPRDVLGATVLREPDGDIRWRVVADPDGVQLCVFGPREGEPDGAFELVVDSADPQAIAAWWADRFGVAVHQEPGSPLCWLEDVPLSPYRYWVFVPVPEPKTAKNRVHWDVNLTDARLEDLLAAGASVVRERDDEIRWTVLADPEGNEFCAFAD